MTIEEIRTFIQVELMNDPSAQVADDEDLLLSGRLLDCAEAEQLGLVTWRVPAAELEQKIEEIGRRITSKSAAVTRKIKRAVQAGRGRSFEEGLAEAERIYLEELLETEDAREGIEAFLAKRSPQWRHR